MYRLVPKKVPNDPRLPRDQDKIICNLGHDTNRVRNLLSWDPSLGNLCGLTTLGPSQNLNFSLLISWPFWNSIINGPKHALKLPSFFSFKLRGGGSFLQFPCSLCVPIMFHLGSQWVPIKFSICYPSSQRVPQHVFYNTSFLSHMLSQMLPSFPLCRWAKGEDFHVPNITFYFGKPPKLPLY